MDIAGELKKGLGLHQEGRLAEAGDIYAGILEAEPDNTDALNLMGVVLQAAGDCVGAIELLQRATELAPDYFAAHVNLGNAQLGAGRLDDALEAPASGDQPERGSARGPEQPGQRPQRPRPPPGGRGCLRPRPGAGAPLRRGPEQPGQCPHGARPYRRGGAELSGVPGHRRGLGRGAFQPGQRAHGFRLDRGGGGQLRPRRGPGRGRHGQALQPGQRAWGPGPRRRRRGLLPERPGGATRRTPTPSTTWRRHART